MYVPVAQRQGVTTTRKYIPVAEREKAPSVPFSPLAETPTGVKTSTLPFFQEGQITPNEFAGTLLKGAGQGLARAWASTGARLAKDLKIAQTDIVDPKSVFGTSPTAQKIASAVFGKTEPFTAKIEDKEFLEAFGTDPEIAAGTGGSLTLLLSALDLTGAGGIPKGLAGAIKAIKAVKTTEEALKVAKGLGLADDIASQYADIFVKAKTAKEAKSALEGATKLQNTTKTTRYVPVAERTNPVGGSLQTGIDEGFKNFEIYKSRGDAKGMADEVNYISKRTGLSREDVPLASEARKYKSAEEFVKANLKSNSWSEAQKSNPDLWNKGILRRSQSPMGAKGVIPDDVHSAQAKWQNYGQYSEIEAGKVYDKVDNYGYYLDKEGNTIRDVNGNALQNNTKFGGEDSLVSNEQLKQNLIDSFSTPEGKKYLGEVINALPKNPDGSITAYRIGGIGEGGLQSYTLSEGMAKTFSNQGTDILPAGTPGLPKGGYKDFGPLPTSVVKIDPKGIKAWSPYDAEILVEPKYVKTKSQLTDFYNKVRGEKLPELPKIKVSEIPVQKTTEGRQTKQVIGGEKPKEIVKTENQLLRDRIRAEARGATSASKDIRSEISRRRNLINSIKDTFNLTDGEMASVLQGRDYRFMGDGEFQDFLKRVDERATLEAELSDKRAIVKGTIFEKELVKVENLQKALKLPPIDQMTIQQLDEFDKILEQFKQGDEFLGVRQIETVENTNLKGIKTIREAREALAKEAGVPVEQLDNIKVSELDRYRYDTALARQNPFYDLMVREKNQAVLNAEMGFYEIKEELNKLINNARKSKPRSLLQRIIPTDKQIFNWLEADEIGKAKLAKEMTPEELKAGEYIQKLYIDARDYLVQHQVLKRYISDYITHIRRGFLEAWQEDGLITAFKEVFDKYKQDEAIFNILNQQTGQILPLEKFFQFSMRRTGELEPTKNVASAVQAYFRAFEKKKALDSLVPKLDIYAHSLTPKRLTPKGLEFDNSLKRFVKEWVNSKKGRVADTVMVKPGGKIDWILRTGVALTRILDLGLSVPIGIASNFGEQITTFRTLGTSQYALGLKRLATKQGRGITTKYKNFVGEPLMERLRDASQGLGDQLTTTMFSLFGAASRRANQVFLLANMSADEFAKGAITTERLARLQTQMGRSRVVENFESIIGKTAPGKVGTQYKSWAVPILSSTLDDINKVSKMLKNGDTAIMQTQEFKELMRTVVLTGALGFGLYGFVEEQSKNKDRTFIEDLAFKSARDSLTLIGALDPSFWTTSPRLLSFLNDLGTAIKQIVLVEKTKDGELKAPKTIGRTLTPKAIKQFTTEDKGGGGDLGLPALPKLPSLPSLPKLPKL